MSKNNRNLYSVIVERRWTTQERLNTIEKKINKLIKEHIELERLEKELNEIIKTYKEIYEEE